MTCNPESNRSTHRELLHPPRRPTEMPRRTSLARLLPLACAGFILCSVLPAAAQQQPYEIGIANREAGRLRYLAERLAKENLLYQLHLADVQKRDMHLTVNEIDRILELLQIGSTHYSIAAPPSEVASKQLDAIAEAWSPVRTLALASPYDYLRRAQQFVPPESPRGDPMIVKSFDKMSSNLIVAVEKLMDEYYAECVNTKYRLCAVSRSSGKPIMLAERMMKDIVFIHAGIDVERSTKQLRASRSAFDVNWVEFEKAELYRMAIDPSRGDNAKFVSGLRNTVDDGWATLKSEVDLAIAGRINEVHLLPVLEIERKMVQDFERFVAVLGRFAAGMHGR